MQRCNAQQVPAILRANLVIGNTQSRVRVLLAYTRVSDWHVSTYCYTFDTGALAAWVPAVRAATFSCMMMPPSLSLPP